MTENLQSNERSVDKAVCVRNASKGYGLGKRRSNVLRSLHMTIRKGTIYGLLGASGCGKTTLLSCIVGRRGLDSGEVNVFGGEPGTKESGIPGPRVGYMPQELALYGEFTIKETLEYFGRIYNLSSSFVKSQTELLFELLDMPPGHRFVKTLSGGQQRRLSFAVALFHEPELLILDEPTVGVDPLLRQRIWSHLVRLSSEHGTTVIVTTHYIEEARQAHTIGLMRSGHLLAEESPHNLLAIHGLISLEDVFLKLCVKESRGSQNVAVIAEREQQRQVMNDNCGHDNQTFLLEDENSDANSNLKQVNSNSVGTNDCESSTNTANLAPRNSNGEDKQKLNSPDTSHTNCVQYSVIDKEHSSVQHSTRHSRTFISNFSPPSVHRTMALIRKNYVQTFRNFGLFLFIFLSPVGQAILFCLSIGREPTSLKIAIVNQELDLIQGRNCSYSTDCSYFMLSCRYLRFIDNQTILQVPYADYDRALEATKRGEVNGVIHFGQNFTDHLVVRQSERNSATYETIVGSQINISLDQSNQQIWQTLQHHLVNAFEDFNNDITKACSYEEDSANIPISFLKPIYGKKTIAFTDFMAPGIILTIMYFMATAMTATSFIKERKEGLLDRSLVAGVQISEIMIAHTVNQLTVLMGQSALVFLFIITVFKVACIGSVPLAIFITVIQGFCGMCNGLLISAICDSEVSAIYFALGGFYPNILLSGVIWPIEGMAPYLRYMVYFLPQTYSIESVRNIFARGWGVERPEVYLGVLISFGWIFATLAITIIAVRLRKYTG